MLDACVLYPSVLRRILLGVAEAGLIAPLWSPRLLEEWVRTAERRGDGPEARAAIAQLAAHRPEAMVVPDPAVEARLWLPDPADAHVLAAAIEGRAEAIVTLNLRDFPRGALAPEGLRAVHPDALLMELWLAAPEGVEAACSAALGVPAGDARGALKRARLPRLAKALAA